MQNTCQLCYSVHRCLNVYVREQDGKAIQEVTT